MVAPSLSCSQGAGYSLGDTRVRDGRERSKTKKLMGSSDSGVRHLMTSCTGH